MTEKYDRLFDRLFGDLEFYRNQRALEAQMNELRARERARVGMSDAAKMIAIAAGASAAINQFSDSMAATAEYVRTNMTHAMQNVGRELERIAVQIRYESTGILYQLGLDVGDGIAEGILSAEEMDQMETADLLSDFFWGRGWDEMRGLGWIAYHADWLWTRLIFALPVWLWKDRKLQRARGWIVIKVNRWINRILKIESPSFNAREYMIAETREWAELWQKYCGDKKDPDPDPEEIVVEMNAGTDLPIDFEARGNHGADFTIEVRRGKIIEHDPDGRKGDE